MFDLWERHAEWWQANFTHGADPEYEDQIIPVVLEQLAPVLSGRVLDVGCGEGQIARRLASSSTLVVGCDTSTAQLRRAVDEAGGPAYLWAEATELPFVDAGFSGAATVLVLEHVPDLDAALAELGRVLEDGGKAVIVLNHPLFQTPDSGWVEDEILEESYWRVGAYLDETVTDEEVDVGVVLPFHHRPLSRYVNGLAAAGLVLESLIEPGPPRSFLDLAPSYARSAAIPRIAVLVARRA